MRLGLGVAVDALAWRSIQTLVGRVELGWIQEGSGRNGETEHVVVEGTGGGGMMGAVGWFQVRGQVGWWGQICAGK